MISVRDVERLRTEIVSVAGGLDLTLHTAEEAALIVEHAAAIKNIAVSLESMAAARVADTNIWKRSGERSAAEWLARRTGTTAGQASDRIKTGKRMQRQPRVRREATSGRLSQEQSSVIADAVEADPAAEEQLVDHAAKETLGDTRDRCRRTKVAADPDREATHARIKAERRLRTWTDSEGGWNLSVRNVPEAGAEIEAGLRKLTDEIFNAARNDARVEPHDAYRADALTELARRFTTGPAPASTATPPKRPTFLGLLRADLSALQRGKVIGDELCEIVGIGPIPISVARLLFGEAVLQLIITNGVDVANVTHLGRRPTREQRAAMLWANPRCATEGCNQPWREADHRIDWTTTRHTRLDELEGHCHHCHDLKTYKGWALIEGKGRRPMVPPDDPRHPNNTGRPPPGGNTDPATATNDDTPNETLFSTDAA
jgi:hypothetical protein